MTRSDGGVRRTLDLYYDAAPRTAARVEETGPFTLFAGTGPWPYYAWPRLRMTHEFTTASGPQGRAERDAAVDDEGLGDAVTGTLVEDALEHDAETVFLSAGSDDIARVHHRLGFRRVGTACIVG